MTEVLSFKTPTPEWKRLYEQALRGIEEGSSSAIHSAMLTMALRFHALSWKETRERRAILTGLADLYVLQMTAARYHCIH